MDGKLTVTDPAPLLHFDSSHTYMVVGGWDANQDSFVTPSNRFSDLRQNESLLFAILFKPIVPFFSVWHLLLDERVNGASTLSIGTLAVVSLISRI